MSDAPKPKFDWNSLNLFALLSLIFSVTGITLPGIVLGHIALVQLKSKAQAGRQLAIWGLVVGYATIAIFALVGGLAFLMAILGFMNGGMHYGDMRGW